MDDFEVATTFTKKWEGGFSDHPADLGGATNFGVTQKVYDAYRARQGAPGQHVGMITPSEVADIYSDYWMAAKCHRMEYPINVVHFDTAFNMGVSRANKFLQECLGVKQDGVIGPLTLAALESFTAATVAKEYLNAREAYYHKIVDAHADQCVFFQGWINRVNDLRKTVNV
jgi:lysozyme family protein